MINILFRNGSLLLPTGLVGEDLLISDGRIARTGNINPATIPGCEVVDATGRIILPGGIDPHVHFALPTPAGLSCDDFISGSQAALAGGTTRLFDFATPRRGQSLKEALRLRRAEAAQSLIPCGLHLGISEWNDSSAKEVVECIEKENVKSLKAYLAYRDSIGISPESLDQLMRSIAGSGAVLMVHCEDGAMIGHLQQEYLASGRSGPAYHSLSRPAEAEIRAIDQVIELSGRTRCPVYIVHISTRRGAELVAEGKRDGIEVFGETCPQYLLLDNSRYDPALSDDQILPYIISPPLRSRDDQEGLWEALANGNLDVVATDHCPFHLRGQKERGRHDFSRIPNGAGGVEHRLGLLYTFGVKSGKISWNRFSELISWNPARIFGIAHETGRIEPGLMADLVVWNPEIQHVISVNSHYSLCDNDIFEHFICEGRAESVFVGGEKLVFET